MVKVSCIIPVFNNANFIEKTINSLVNQTYSDIEIILVNDGSTDNSVEIIENIRKKDSRITLINQLNQGVSIARNNGISKATGEYIIFVDADDYVDKGMIECLTQQMIDFDLDVIECGYYIVGESNEKRKIEFDLEVVDDKFLIIENLFKYHNSSPYVWGKLYKTSIVKKVMFDTSISYSEDLLFNVSYYLLSNKKASVSNAFYNYVLNPSSALNQKFNKKKLSALDAQKLIIYLLNENSMENLIKYPVYFQLLLCLRYYIEIYSSNDIKMKEKLYSMYKDLFEKLKPELKNIVKEKKTLYGLILFRISPKFYLYVKKFSESLIRIN